MPTLSVTLTDEQFAALEHEHSEFCRLLERAWCSPDRRPSVTFERFVSAKVTEDFSIARLAQAAHARVALIECTNAETITAVARQLRRARLYGLGWVHSAGEATDERYERAVRFARGACEDLCLPDRYAEQLGRALAEEAWPIEAVAHDFEGTGASRAHRPHDMTAG